MLREILTTVRRLDTRVEDLDGKIVALEDGISFANHEIAKLKNENLQLKAENAALALRMNNVISKLEEMGVALERESQMRDQNEANERLIKLEVSGIPKTEGEKPADCKEHVAKVLTLIGSENSKDCIDVAHRKMAGGIIVCFKSRSQRDEVYLKRFNLVGKTSLDLGFPLPDKVKR